jgi:hypothetical protein
MLLPLIPVRLHGWLDEIATLTYLGLALFVGWDAGVRLLLVFGAVVHIRHTSRRPGVPHFSSRAATPRL